jgi:hypothetical protein
MEPKLAIIDGFHGITIKENINVHKLKYFQTNSTGAGQNYGSGFLDYVAVLFVK